MGVQIFWDQKLGEGGEGVVFRGALDGRPCAVKVPQGHELGRRNPSLRRRLADGLRPELDRVRQAKGSHLIALLGHNLDALSDVPFLVYELAEGGSLQDELDALASKNRRMLVSVAATHLDDLLVALTQLHQRGLIHRDIKPANFLRTQSGTYKLADLGLGRSLDRPCDAQTVFFRGTPAYAAPEQIEHQCFGVGADLFAVGGVAWAMLMGAPPARARPLPSLISVRPDATLLEPLIVRLLSADPRRRPASAQAVLEELRALRRAIDRPQLCACCGLPCNSTPCDRCGRVHH